MPLPIRATKCNILRMRASKHMRPEMIRGMKKKIATTMHSFLPPAEVAGRELDTELTGNMARAQSNVRNAGVVADKFIKDVSMPPPPKRMRGAIPMPPPGPF